MGKPSSDPRQQSTGIARSGEASASAASSDKKYRGVRKRTWGKYVSEIRLPNCRERIWLGSYDTPEKAARAFDAALYCLRGAGARFNFPDDPPHIENGRSMTPSEIQVAAARFAQSRELSGRVENVDSGSDDALSETSDALWSHADDYSPTGFGGVRHMEYEIPEMPLHNGFLDQFGVTGNGDVADMGLFPEFNEYIGTGDYFAPPLPGPDNNNNNNNNNNNINNNWQESNSYEELNTLGGSFLWDF